MSAERLTTEELQALYAAPSPYVTVYFDHASVPISDTWPAHRIELAKSGAPGHALDAIDVEVQRDQDDDVAGWAIFAAADGTTLVRSSPDAPNSNVIQVGELPYVAPVLEWNQHAVAHTTIFCGPEGSDAVAFRPSESALTAALPADVESAAELAKSLIESSQSTAVVIGGHEATAKSLTSDLRQQLPATVSLHRVEGEAGQSIDSFVDATVRQISHEVAARTVSLLREFRFQASHNTAVEGADATLDAIRNGRADVVLVHDDPTDDRQLPVGVDLGKVANFTDVVIRDAILADATVRIIPTTGEGGPDENIGAICRALPSVSEQVFSEKA